ncbi:katanin p60 ATPase-containing subunit A-like 2 [Lasioglossum baleicum]|uniref:katanin p60 ATPase-containing subunit A-like 2 n=1 Tax=Lasioglossum baleicum TaxID=434251 RepID=UPI003FCDD9C9
MDTQMNSIHHSLREKEEKRTLQRRRDLLYLIADYLKNRGYTKSSNTIATEAQLTESVQVCDNIDLETILKCYDIYYTSTYNKLPALCKHSKGRSNVTETNNKQNENKPSKKSDKQEEKKEDDVNNVSFAMTVRPIFANRSSNSESSMKLSNDGSLPPVSVSIENLYGDDIEMRKIAETISREILVKNCNVHWDDVIGLKQCKRAIINAIVYPIKYPELFREKFSSWKGVLLYGPPGTGKTMLAKAVATECKCTFFNVSVSSLVSKWRGDSEKYVRALFDLAYERAPTVIFIDEIDWIATKEDLSEPARRFRAELLAKFDGLTTDENARIVLLAATNAPWNIDSALLRRLEKHVRADLPNEEDRFEMLSAYFSKEIDHQVLKDVNAGLKNCSGADIKVLCKQTWLCQIRPLIELLENNKVPSSDINYELTDPAILATTLRDMRCCTISNEEIQLYYRWEKEKYLHLYE